MTDQIELERSLNYVPYAPRRIRFEGLRKSAGHRLKVYSVIYGEVDLAHDRFEPGISTALEQLPVAAPERGRPGLGFIVLHQGRAGDYVVLSWWDRENELPTHVFVREGGDWRPADVNESFCVWDLEVMWFERLAYVEAILGGQPPTPSAYLNARYECTT